MATNRNRRVLVLFEEAKQRRRKSYLWTGFAAGIGIVGPRLAPTPAGAVFGFGSIAASIGFAAYNRFKGIEAAKHLDKIIDGKGPLTDAEKQYEIDSFAVVDTQTAMDRAEFE